MAGATRWVPFWPPTSAASGDSVNSLFIADYGFSPSYLNKYNVGGTTPVEIGLVQSKALQVRGIIGSAGLWPRTIRFMATSGVDPSPLLSATFPLRDGTSALEAARDTARNVKVQIEC